MYDESQQISPAVPVSLELAGVLELTTRTRSPLMMPTLVAVPCNLVWVVLDVPITVV
jgi:hypothetical protein